MKKYFILFIIITIFFQIQSILIENITNISNGILIEDLNVMSGSILRHENRLIVQGYYKIEEYQILADGTLEQTSTLETRHYPQSAKVDGNNTIVFNPIMEYQTLTDITSLYMTYQLIQWTILLLLHLIISEGQISYLLMIILLFFMAMFTKTECFF